MIVSNKFRALKDVFKLTAPIPKEFQRRPVVLKVMEFSLFLIGLVAIAAIIYSLVSQEFSVAVLPWAGVIVSAFIGAWHFAMDSHLYRIFARISALMLALSPAVLPEQTDHYIVKGMALYLIVLCVLDLVMPTCRQYYLWAKGLKK
ncbi:hypothetical protein QP938_10285 [Porticoccaceae bacterium LTM1]|nr:hypothetical protein QP938_10285 [Porticoccaceae bacterium LTM1]